MVWDPKEDEWYDEGWKEMEKALEEAVAERCPWCRAVFESNHRWLCKGSLVCRSCAEQFHPEWSDYDHIR